MWGYQTPTLGVWGSFRLPVMSFYEALEFLRLLQTSQNLEILYKIKYRDDGEAPSSKPLLITLTDSPGLSCHSLRCEWLLL